MADAAINILLVEDNPGDARLIREILNEGKLAGHEIETAEKLETAISRARERRFDVIILDLNLPDSTGLDTLERMVAATGEAVPVIILTGLSDETLGESSIMRGAEDYLVKGEVTSVTLSRSIRYSIERKKMDTDFRESREIFRQFMDHSPIYVFFKDDGLRSLRLSKNYETMLGKPFSELLGKTMDELFPSDFAKNMIADDIKIMKEGRQVTIEEEFNGRIYQTIKFPISHMGMSKYLAGYSIDITERKKAESQLTEQIAELQRWHNITLCREGRVLELKREVNELLRMANQPLRYPSAEVEVKAEKGT